MMNRLAQQASLALGLAGLSLISGCTEEQESLIVVRALPLELADDGISCSASAGNDANLATIQLDVSFDTGYVGAFDVLNNLQQTTIAGTNQGVEASEMQLVDAIVELSTPANPELTSGIGDAALTRFTLPLATDSFIGQQSLAPFVNIPAASLAGYRTTMTNAGIDSATLVLSVSFRARRSSNTGVNKSGLVESRVFDFPISMCLNCLRACEGLGAGTCTTENCLDTTFGSGGACGAAQGLPVSPPCCDSDAANDVGCG